MVGENSSGLIELLTGSQLCGDSAKSLNLYIIEHRDIVPLARRFRTGYVVLIRMQRGET